jgi:hypothetical protein
MADTAIRRHAEALDLDAVLAWGAIGGPTARAGATRAVFEFDPGNTAMQRLVLRFGGRFESLDGRGVVPL